VVDEVSIIRGSGRVTNSRSEEGVLVEIDKERESEAVEEEADLLLRGEREAKGERDRQTETQRETETEREKESERDTERQRQRESERERQREVRRRRKTNKRPVEDRAVQLRRHCSQ
jgi:hypothetical protein